jgi:16S rRNA processing protein RimM
VSPLSLPREAGVGLLEGELDLGYVSGVFGVRGEVRLFLHNRTSTLLDKPREVVLIADDGVRVRAKLVVRSGAGKRVLGKVEGVDDPDAAEALMGMTIAVARASLPRPRKDEWYVADLIGCKVIVDGEVVGEVVFVHETPGGDLMELAVGEEREFVPLLRQWLKRVDVAAREIELTERAWD